MPFWKRPRAPETRPPRTLPALDDRVRHRLRGARRRRADGRFLGRHGARFRGFSAHFAEYRPYAPGDDPRFLDQRVLARSDRDVVKLARLETTLRCIFILDATASMRFRNEAKFAYACRTAHLGAAVLDDAGDAFGLYVCGAETETLPPGRGPAHRGAFTAMLERIEPRGGPDALRGLDRAAALLRGASLGILLSDFIAPDRELFAALNALSDTGADLGLFQVLLAEERRPALDHDAERVDPETGARLRAGGPGYAEAYAAVAARHRAALDRFARERGFVFLSLDPGVDAEVSVWERFLEGETGQRQW